MIISTMAALGKILERHAAIAVLIAILFAYGTSIPPREIFGSAEIEDAKDILAFAVAALGLGLRAIVLMANGKSARFRYRLYAANLVILFAILLMHGNSYVIAIGSSLGLAAYLCIVRTGARDGPAPRLRAPVEWAMAGLTLAVLALTELYEETSGGVAPITGAAAFALAHPQAALPYAGLFITALIAGTILPFVPGSSEMALAGLLVAGLGDPGPLVAVAAVGSVLGCTANYVVGLNVARLAGRRWFPVSPGRLTSATRWFRRYGVWTLLLSWLPGFGDAITFAAGLLRADARVFLVLTSFGKTAGLVAVASGVTWIF